MIPYARILTPSLGLAGVILLLTGWLMHTPTIAIVGGGLMVVAMLIATTVAAWSGFRFTLWIGIANMLAMLFRERFRSSSDFAPTIDG